MVDPSKVAFWTPPELKKFKRALFDRIGAGVRAAGGIVLYDDFTQLDRLPSDRIPVVGCSPYLRPLIEKWRQSGRPWCYFDRGYWLRVFATDLPQGRDGGMYRWHVNSFQAQEIRDVPDDRLRKYPVKLWPWKTEGRHIVLAEPSATYQRFHGIEGWTDRTIAELKRHTDRPIVVRDKEMQRFGRKLHEDLAGAHALVTHGSNAAVESAIMGCPVFVHPDSAASLVGLTDLSQIETPIYPDREAWCRSLSYSQWSEREMIDGTLWKHLA